MTKSTQLKSEIRVASLSRRDAMSDTERGAGSEKLIGFANELGVTSKDIVAGFFPIRSEIDVRPLMFEIDDTGARLCLPVVLDSETIEFRHWSLGAALVKTGFGTLGPDTEAEIVDPTILFTPLAAFDNSGNRIGYGGGFYDRAIAKLHEKGLKPRLVGVAFECQRVENVPTEAHDVPLDMILTENGLQNFGA